MFTAVQAAYKNKKGRLSDLFKCTAAQAAQIKTLPSCLTFPVILAPKNYPILTQNIPQKSLLAVCRTPFIEFY